MPTDDQLDLGHVKEGVVEIDPMTGRMVLRCAQQDGTFEYFDVQAALERYQNEEVRVILVPFATINKVAQMVESGQISASQAPKAG
jgi:hypothetical protein